MLFAMIIVRQGLTMNNNVRNIGRVSPPFTLRARSWRVDLPVHDNLFLLKGYSLSLSYHASITRLSLQQ